MGTYTSIIMNPTVIGKNLRRILHERNLNANAAGKLCGLAHTTIIRIISGEKRNTKLTTLDKLTSGLGITFAELMRNEQNQDVAAQPTPVLSARGR